MNPNLPGGGVNQQQLKQKGQLQLGLQWVGTYVRTEHDVDKEDFERDIKTGKLKDIQAYKHLVDVWLMNVDLNARLGITEWFSVALQMPLRLAKTSPQFEDAQGGLLTGFTSIHHRDETLFGIGDVGLQSFFRILQPLKHRGWLLEVGIGLTFPAGGTEPNPDRLKKEGKEHQHIFFGSGTFDPTASLTVSYSLPLLRILGWSNVRASLYENTFGYRAGAKLTAGLGVSTGFGLKTWTFLLQAEVYYEAPSRWSGNQDDENSGRTDLIPTIGVYWQPVSTLQLNLMAKFPITVQVIGAQLSIPMLVLFGVTYTFSLF